MLIKLGAPDEAAEHSRVHAASWYGIQTARDLKEAAPLLCGVEEQIQEEDCQVAICIKIVEFCIKIVELCI